MVRIVTKRKSSLPIIQVGDGQDDPNKSIRGQMRADDYGSNWDGPFVEPSEVSFVTRMQSSMNTTLHHINMYAVLFPMEIVSSEGCLFNISDCSFIIPSAGIYTFTVNTQANRDSRISAAIYINYDRTAIYANYDEIVESGDPLSIGAYISYLGPLIGQDRVSIGIKSDNIVDITSLNFSGYRIG